MTFGVSRRWDRDHPTGHFCRLHAGQEPRCEGRSVAVGFVDDDLGAEDAGVLLGITHIISMSEQDGVDAS